MPEEPGFEERLLALEEAVARLESGEESLEDSLGVYEAAVGHLKACHEIIEKAERRVRVLTEDGEEDLDGQEGP